MAAASSSSGRLSLPYSLKSLSWDAQHQFNSQNKYGYTGKQRRLSDPMLQCEMCDQWFFAAEVSCITPADRFVAFQRNYRFRCRICGSGVESWEALPNTWTSIVLTAMYNLHLSDDEASLGSCKWLSVKEISAWIEAHWGSLTRGRDLLQLQERDVVSKALFYNQQSSGFFVPSEDKTKATLKSVAMSKLQLKPHQSGPLTSMPLSGMSKPAKGCEQAGASNKRKRGGKGQAAAKDTNKPAPPPATEIKLPDKYRLLPVPKTEVSYQDPSIVQLSKTSRAPQLTIHSDGLTVVGQKGYRMVRATHGVSSGSWYYEVTVNPYDKDGHIRLGWCTEMGDVQAPVGYDQNSYAYRDIHGSKFHESVGREYGRAFGVGDVIGCWIQMGEPAASVRMRQRINIKGVEYIVEEERERTPSVGSHITFFVNGVSQGPAFTDIWAELYFPAVSLYRDATVTCNFGPHFRFPPPPELKARPCSELALPKTKEAEGKERNEGEDKEGNQEKLAEGKEGKNAERAQGEMTECKTAEEAVDTSGAVEPTAGVSVQRESNRESDAMDTSEEGKPEGDVL